MAKIQTKLCSLGKYILIGLFQAMPAELGLTFFVLDKRRPIDFYLLIAAFVLYALCGFFSLSASTQMKHWIISSIAVGVDFTVLFAIKSRCVGMSKLITLLTEGSGTFSFVSIYQVTNKSVLWYFLSWTTSKVYIASLYILIYKLLAKSPSYKQKALSGKRNDLIIFSVLLLVLSALYVIASVMYKQDVEITAYSAYYITLLLIPAPIFAATLICIVLAVIMRMIYKAAYKKGKQKHLQYLKIVGTVISFSLMAVIFIVKYFQLI